MSSTFCMFVRQTSLFGINQHSYFISQMSLLTTVSEGHLRSTHRHVCTLYYNKTDSIVVRKNVTKRNLIKIK